MDSEVKNFDYSSELEDYSPEYFITWAKRVVDRCWERAEEEKELSKTHDYRQCWLMSKEQWESLPDDAIWSDMVEAGAQFMGYQWVKKDEE